MPLRYTEVDGGRRLIGRETARLRGEVDGCELSVAIEITTYAIVYDAPAGWRPIRITAKADARKRDGGSRGARWYVSVVFEKSSHVG